MAVPLQRVSSRLQILSSKLRRDSDIQLKIKDIAKNTKIAAERFKSSLREKGSRILLQKTLLLNGRQDETNIENVQAALKAGTEAFGAIRKQIICIQADINNCIDICKARKASYEPGLADLLTKLTKVNAEIDNLWTNIATHEEEAAAASSEAFDLTESVARKRKAAEQNMHNARLMSMAGGIVGIVLAPFTGGQSLAMTQATTHFEDLHLDEAKEMETNASRLRNEADYNSRQARKLRLQTTVLKRQRATFETKVEQMQIGIDGLTEATTALQQVSSFLLPALHALDNLVHVFQDMYTALDEVSKQSNSYEIVRSAFASQQPEVTKDFSDLGDKWKKVEGLLSQHDVQSL